jgi:hypothetical protein
MMARRARALALSTVLLLAATALSGCVAIKSQSADSRLPGVVTINVSICASNRQSAASTCIPRPDSTPGQTPNTAEGDNGVDAPSGGQPQPGQLLVGFRVPDGTVAPGEFTSPNGEVFSKSPSYTAALTADHPAPAGLHWEGYISSSVQLEAGFSLTSFSAEFGLPSGPGGAPFGGPFRWRAIVGIRLVSGDAGAPVDCGQGSDCYDSPTTAGGAGDLDGQFDEPVSDFRVLQGTGAGAAPGETATVSFPVRYSDNAAPRFGPRTLRLTAASALPGNPTVTPSALTLTIASGAAPSVTARVIVPAGTAPGTYPVTLTAADGSPAVTRSNTATVTVVDKTAPSIRIGSPTDGETLTQGQRIAADYSCADEANGSGPASCAGPVPSGAPIDTATPGQKTFTVTAQDNAGNVASLARTYTVAAPVVLPKPRINATVTFLFAARKTSTKFTALSVRGVPKGATVVATCKGKRCPAGKVKGKRRALSFTKKNASGSVTLRPWVRKSLGVGTVLTVSVTKPDSIGIVKTIAIRRSKAPKVTTSCLQPGAKNASRCS